MNTMLTCPKDQGIGLLGELEPGQWAAAPPTYEYKRTSRNSCAESRGHDGLGVY
jgi:hypothetical protein